MKVSPPTLGTLHEPITNTGSELCSRLEPCLAVLGAESDENDRLGRFPMEAFQALRESGVLGATVPARFGGGGLSHLHDVAVLLGRVAQVDPGAALATHMQFSRGLTLTYEVDHGAEPTRPLSESLLRGMATGECVVASATKDIGAATRVEGRADTLVLSGRKTLVSLAPLATHFLVQAAGEVEGQPRNLAVLVHRNDANVSVHEEWNGVGMRTSGTAKVHFDSVPIDADCIFDRGQAGVSSDTSLAGQTISSITMLGIYVAIAQRARDLAVEHLRSTGMSSAAAARTLVSDIDTRLFAVRSASAAALGNANHLSNDLSGDLDERGRSMMTPFQYAKSLVNTIGVGIVDDAIRLVGGLAYTDAHPLWRMSRDIRANIFAHPYNLVNRVDYLSAQAFR